MQLFKALERERALVHWSVHLLLHKNFCTAGYAFTTIHTCPICAFFIEDEGNAFLHIWRSVDINVK